MTQLVPAVWTVIAFLMGIGVAVTACALVCG